MIQKAEISRAEQGYSEKWCRRCDRYFCVECVDFHMVEFDIDENVNIERPDLPKQMENWKGQNVCPWCYNQLVDKKNAEEKGSM
jgi:hypothetical protein